MANADNALKARMGKLKKDADDLGITYQEDITEEMLRAAIKEAKELAGDKEPKEVAPTQGFDYKEFAKALGSEIAKGNKEAKEEQGNEETFIEVDPADIGEIKFYYVPYIFWILPAKRVAGRLVKAPYRKIVFKLDRGSAVQVGTQWQTRYMSVYATDNMKEQLFMETHPLFNRVFFLSHKEAQITNDQVKYAQAFAKHLQSLGTVMAPELYQRAAHLDLRISHDMSLSALRTALAERMATAEIEAGKAQLHAIMAEQSRATLLTQQQT